MKNTLLLMLSAIFLQIVTSAQKVNTVAESVQKLTIAMESAEETVLTSMVSDNLSYGHSNGIVEDKKSFIQSLVSGTSDFLHIDISEQTISITGTIAIVRHVLRASTNDKGKPGEINLRVLQVWIKSKKHWILLARQAVKSI